MAWSNPRRRLPGVVAGYETKDATAFRDELRSVPPGPQLSGGPNEDVRVGEKAADGANVQRWYDCPDCGYEAPTHRLRRRTVSE